MPPSGYPKTTLDLGFLYLLLSLPLLLLLLTTLSCTLVISFLWSPGGQDGVFETAESSDDRGVRSYQK